MSGFTDLAAGLSCPTCGSAVVTDELLIWPDGVATGLCNTCYRDLLFPPEALTPHSD